ncbi:hypothetical protein [Bacillus sp. ISL-46]|nr:hypothetical protein [Bacillus sp. ISL-46]
MITALIGIQTTCIVIASKYVIKHFRTKLAKLKDHSKGSGFKHYKSF